MSAREKLEQARGKLVARAADIEQKIARMREKGNAVVQSIEAIDATLAKDATPAAQPKPETPA